MAITEDARFEMHLKLRTVLGEKVADLLMEHLPPSGWGDVARKADVELLSPELRHLRETTVAKFETMNMRFSHIDSRLRGIVAGMWAMGGIMSAFLVAILTKI